MEGEPCPNCEEESFFSIRSVPNSTNLIFKCRKCGYEIELQASAPSKEESKI
jgi:ribosomal protein L37AE/L43A